MVIYSFDSFAHVLSVGLGDPAFEQFEENDFESILNLIELKY